MAHYNRISVEDVADHVRMIRINRPEAANAFDTATARELLDAFQELHRDDCDIRAAILTGTGERAFCAGADLKERDGMSRQEWEDQHRLFEDMADSIRECPVPVIAAVNGAAYAGGCELALACDFIYAADNARFALTEVTLGLIPGIGGTQMLSQAIGVRRAKEILTTGRPFSAADAYVWGMINRMCSGPDLVSEAVQTARTVAANAPLSVKAVLRSVDDGIGGSVRQGIAVELDNYNRLIDTHDRKEGIAAFNEKRRPDFKSR